MSGEDQGGMRSGVSVRALEFAISGAIMGLGALVMYDNWMLGARWAGDGPEAGYFPFYVGLLMFVSAAIVFLQNLFRAPPWRRFVAPSQLRSVLTLLVPSILYIAFTAFAGIYIASMLYLGYFMRVLGRYGWALVAPIAIGVPVLMFFVFEIWFLVPLPKGPVEDWLGY